jgi:CheY-like chemotaxis protein/predicted transcriptional regulator
MRILRILLENGEMKKSNLCNRAGMNYKVCTKYIDFLARLQWVEIRKATGNSMVLAIPSEGIENLRKLESEEDMAPSSTPMPGSKSWDTGLQLETSGKRNPASHTGHNLREGSGIASRAKDEYGNHAKSHKVSAGRGKKRILIIDDDENALFTYSSFLEGDKSLQTKTFSDPRKALAYLTTHPSSADLILLDIRMPSMSGLRVYQSVKALDPNANIIFLSSLDAAPELGDLLSDVKLDNNRFMKKPVRRSDFIAAVQKAVS